LHCYCLTNIRKNKSTQQANIGFFLSHILESDAMLFKKIAIAAAVATTLAFVGCAKKTEEAAADANSAASEAVEAASEAEAAASAATVEAAPAADAAASQAAEAASVAVDAAADATAASEAAPKAQ
jgi:hypothetical protein